MSVTQCEVKGHCCYCSMFIMTCPQFNPIIVSVGEAAFKP